MLLIGAIMPYGQVQSILDLVLRKAPLCRHEVLLLERRCAKLKRWYRKFNMARWKESMTPKLHRLIEHVALFARAWARVGISPGMLSEQGTEHTHGVIGSLDLKRKHMAIEQRQRSKFAALCAFQAARPKRQPLRRPRRNLKNK